MNKLKNMLETSSSQKPTLLDDDMLDLVAGGGCEVTCERTCGTTCDNTCPTTCASTGGNS